MRISIQIQLYEQIKLLVVISATLVPFAIDCTVMMTEKNYMEYFSEFVFEDQYI